MKDMSMVSETSRPLLVNYDRPTPTNRLAIICNNHAYHVVSRSLGKNKCSYRSMEVIMTNQPTNQRTNMRGHREVTLPIIWATKERERSSAPGSTCSLV